MKGVAESKLEVTRRFGGYQRCIGLRGKSVHQLFGSEMSEQVVRLEKHAYGPGPHGSTFRFRAT